MLVLTLFLYNFLFTCCVEVRSRNSCEITEKSIKYYKIRPCFKSTLPMIAWKYTDRLIDCKAFARQKKALALNYSPKTASKYRNSSGNCQVLGCPETDKSLTLVSDLAFDYYSAYGNWNMTENATCIKSVGLFGLSAEKRNFTASIEKCGDIGASVADVLSETRTNHLSQYINDTLQDWYKVVYIGLNDIEQEGIFRTVNGSTLNCYRYRAWAPGHPRSKYKNEDCVVLDTESMWRVVKCSRNFHALCEFHPARPLNKTDFSNIRRDKKNKACQSKDSKIHEKSMREEKCLVIYSVFGNNTNIHDLM